MLFHVNALYFIIYEIKNEWKTTITIMMKMMIFFLYLISTFLIIIVRYLSSNIPFNFWLL